MLDWLVGRKHESSGEPDRGPLFTCRMMIVDEVGYPGVDKEGADLLFQLVSRRYGRRSTIATANVGIGAWAKVFGDPVVASAIADRLCHHCTVLKITGRSYRKKGLAPDRDAGNGA
ncbi:ATP-binding protein [Collinsella phocaeensis]|uniref:ATP-binding protein n=1 Tax=Collinsella phocaeensis TaxID=1871016 RepID=UPI0009312564|nr:ATP-binding protein [Collinsella phocaeensis]